MYVYDMGLFTSTLRVRGHHLFDSLDDGTEMAEPNPFGLGNDSMLEDFWDTNE